MTDVTIIVEITKDVGNLTRSNLTFGKLVEQHNDGFEQGKNNDAYKDDGGSRWDVHPIADHQPN